MLIDAALGWRKISDMKVHVAWSPVEFSNPLRAGSCLAACLSPDGQQVVHLDLQVRRITLRPAPHEAKHGKLCDYVQRMGWQQEQLRVLVGEVHLFGGLEFSNLLLRDILNVLLLSEEPPGNAPVPTDLPLPLESVTVVNQGAAWPGYDRASLEPDGDVLVNHVIMASMVPPPP